MSLNQQSLFRLGVGHGFNAGARLGIWPNAEAVDQPPPRRAHIGIARVADKPLKFRIIARGSSAAHCNLQAEYLFYPRGKGTTRSGVKWLAEHLLSLHATGQSTARIETLSETVFRITASGAVAGCIDLRSETAPVFSDDELMALAAWQYLH